MQPHAETLRIRTVVFPTDGSAWAEHTFAQAAFYAANHDATLHVLRVAQGPPDQPPATAPGLSSDAFGDRLRAVAAASVGLDLVHSGIAARSPEVGILDYAERVGADLVVMSTHGRTGLDRVLTGSTTEAVVRRARCPVLTLQTAAERTVVSVKRILVPTDFSAATYHALAHAVALARLHGAALDLVHIVEPPPEVWIGGEVIGWNENSPRRVDDARAALQDLTDEVGIHNIPLTLHVLMGPPARGILDAAERVDADLIVMGTHGRTGARRLLVGSVTEKVVQRAPCPVFVVNPSGKNLLPTTAEGRKAVSH